MICSGFSPAHLLVSASLQVGRTSRIAPALPLVFVCASPARLLFDSASRDGCSRFLSAFMFLRPRFWTATHKPLAWLVLLLRLNRFWFNAIMLCGPASPLLRLWIVMLVLL